MHPAWSIIFFTTVSGLGFGFSAWIVFGLIDIKNIFQLIIIAGFAFCLICSGLLSSTLHLGHPERAWRALSQWRSSWLSREGVLSVFVLTALTCWFLYTFQYGKLPLWINLIVIILILFTVYATAMIYASLKTVACWNQFLTPVCYLMYSISGGLLTIIWFMSMIGQMITFNITLILLLLIISTWILKIKWWWNLDNNQSDSNLATATGLGSFGEVRSLMPPHTSENYLQKEMGFVIARKHAMKLRILSITLGGIIPIAVLLSGTLSSILLGISLFIHLIGVFIERFLFFAEAKHVVTLYYGSNG